MDCFDQFIEIVDCDDGNDVGLDGEIESESLIQSVSTISAYTHSIRYTPWNNFSLRIMWFHATIFFVPFIRTIKMFGET